MEFESLDWSVLDRLRAAFLTGSAAVGPYWRDEKDLSQYDLTFGERIGWKWDALLSELRRRAWTPPSGLLLDWGCGSGVAGRRVVEAWSDAFPTVAVWDHSPVARAYATRRLETLGKTVAPWKPGDPVGTLALSHVLTELDAKQENEVLRLIEAADTVLWIEPGTRDTGRALAKWRDRLKGDFHVIAPCTHREACPLFQPANDRHWCHFFAPPPRGIYADSNWVRFGQRAGIDLRSLPYSALVLSRTQPAAPLPQGTGRLLGRPSLSKAHLDWLHCDEAGLTEAKLAKRAVSALYKVWDKRPGLGLVAVSRSEDGRVSGAQEVYPFGE